MGKKPRGRVEKATSTELYTAVVKRDTDRRTMCEREGHLTHLFSRFCTRCGWIMTDEEDRQRT